MGNFTQSAEIEIIAAEARDAEDIKSQIEEQDTDLLILFPENFDELVGEYDSAEGGKAPNIEIYYNSANMNSFESFQMMSEVLSQYESLLANKFDINNLSDTEDNTYDLATEQDTVGQTFAMMLPMLMMIFLFSGCMAIAPESIAGEKERGTIATLLVTPIKRNQLAAGKIFSLGVIALLSGISSFLGTFLSLPNLMGAAGTMDVSVYGVTDFIMLFLVIISTILVLISLISIVSAFAKTIKEATTAVLPLMIISMLLGVSAMFGSVKTEAFYYLIPLYNSVQCMSGIFSFSYSSINVIITVISNIVYMIIFTYILTKMFESEKIMFSK